MKLQTLSASVRFVDKPEEVKRQKVVSSVSREVTEATHVVTEAMSKLERIMAEG